MIRYTIEINKVYLIKEWKMSNDYSLDMLSLDQGARVLSIDPKAGHMRRRLQDLGFVENAYVKCVNISPAKDPKAYKISDTVIAIRKSDAKYVYIEV